MVLKVNSSLYEFFWDFRKCLGALFNWLKPAAGLVCNYFKLSRDLFAILLSLSLLSTVADGVLAPCRRAGDAHAVCRRGSGGQRGPDRRAPAPHPPPSFLSRRFRIEGFFLPLAILLLAEVTTVESPPFDASTEQAVAAARSATPSASDPPEESRRGSPQPRPRPRHHRLGRRLPGPIPGTPASPRRRRPFLSTPGEACVLFGLFPHLLSPSRRRSPSRPPPASPHERPAWPPA